MTFDYTCTVNRSVATGEETDSGHAKHRDSTPYANLLCTRPTQRVISSNDGIVQVSDTQFTIRVPRSAELLIGDQITHLIDRNNRVFFGFASVVNIIKNRTHNEVILERG